jgi:hypothetical protein
MPTESSSVKGYIMPILTAIMAPALIAMFTAGWHFAGQVGENSRDLAEAKRELARVYSEGTAALKAHLQDERYADAKFEEVQSDVAEMRNDVKDMRAEQQQQSLLMRELLTEIKMRSPNRPDTP